MGMAFTKTSLKWKVLLVTKRHMKTSIEKEIEKQLKEIEGGGEV